MIIKLSGNDEVRFGWFNDCIWRICKFGGRDYGRIKNWILFMIVEGGASWVWNFSNILKCLSSRTKLEIKVVRLKGKVLGFGMHLTKYAKSHRSQFYKNPVICEEPENYGLIRSLRR